MNTDLSNMSMGWPPIDLESIDNEFKCPECNNIMINAHQADDCGCRYCHDCLDKM
jgi:hypothetical protein